MSRIKRGTVTKKRHKRVLKQAKGFWGLRSKVFTRAQETLLRAMEFAFIGRKLKKRDFRALFISRISAACKKNGISYSKFINALDKINIKINRKMLSQLAIFEPKAFTKLVELAKK
ncbi:50S ribosomal protein L20 [Candidatus Dependentiae bacterium]|nr:50S ribosomal protein L20 [Candidatus Dependentiae bacterium]MBU4387070.1 50S ribosomal protein L20 [Candidatus Dependentiae bacterium]MCG2756222.1 50S ribosomal protein L20 [Candidatus Dependentiae bacterium]